MASDIIKVLQFQ